MTACRSTSKATAQGEHIALPGMRSSLWASHWSQKMPLTNSPFVQLSVASARALGKDKVFFEVLQTSEVAAIVVTQIENLATQTVRPLSEDMEAAEIQRAISNGAVYSLELCAGSLSPVIYFDDSGHVMGCLARYDEYSSFEAIEVVSKAT
jgi:hypothetical protein